jgi:transcriptional regulator with XRE-family HTH domain
MATEGRVTRFSDEIRRHREQLGMTQLDFAAMLGKSMQTVSNWECGRGEPWPSVQARVLGRLRGERALTGSELRERDVVRTLQLGTHISYVPVRVWRGPVDLGELT